MEENNINWLIKSAESPDLNPIELLWHKLKHYIRNTVKPHTKDELVNEITWFWQIHRMFADCAADRNADSCLPRKSFWQIVAKSLKRALLGGINCNESQWPTWTNKYNFFALCRLAIKRHENIWGKNVCSSSTSQKHVAPKVWLSRLFEKLIF